ncbi:uncharacterized protein LOC134540629 [Bacillus rossius redtenbacheri]|uniref:uncharacterized protein LOC134540629 n=1 Tax=Bacillus rossius redtenbacheri TaxID=93214 RepID=UPI002FDD8C7E
MPVKNATMMARNCKNSVNCSCSKLKILMDHNCGKCSKIVKNGIFCENCDLWYHFIKCSNVDPENIPKEEWKCQKCTAKNGGVISDNEQMFHAKNILTDSVMLSELQTAITELTKENKVLQNTTKMLCEEIKLRATNQHVSSHENNKEVQMVITQLREENKSLQEIIKLLQQDIENVRNINRHTNEENNSSGSFAWSTVVKGKLRHDPTHQRIEIPTNNKYSILQTSNGCEPGQQYRARGWKNVMQRSTICESNLVNVNINTTDAKQRNALAKRKRKILLFSDSQGRGLAAEVKSQCHQDTDVFGMVKPSGCFAEVTKHATENSRNLTNEDLVVLSAGGNDVYKNEASAAVIKLKHLLLNLCNTRVAVCNIPRRHDLNEESVINREIEITNKRLQNFRSKFQSVCVIDVFNLPRDCFTKHGLHINLKGKVHVAKQIVSVLQSKNNINNVIPIGYDIGPKN